MKTCGDPLETQEGWTPGGLWNIAEAETCARVCM